MNLGLTFSVTLKWFREIRHGTFILLGNPIYPIKDSRNVWVYMTCKNGFITRSPTKQTFTLALFYGFTETKSKRWP